MQQYDNLAEEAAQWKRARRMAAFTNREFVAAVRAELAAAGRPDVAFDRSWIDEDTSGDRLLVHVPLGTELSVPLKVMNNFFDMRSQEDLKWHATEFAKALVNLKLAESMLVKYARDVRRAANAAVATARAEGLDILLEKVGFKPTYAYHLNQSAWKDAAHHVLSAITVRHTSFFLRPTTSNVWIEEPADVAIELASILEDQRERQALMAELDFQGCDLIVDRITLDLLAAHGLDAADSLERVWKKQCLNLTVQHEWRDTSLSLVTSGGYVTASILLPEAIWNGEHLWFRGGEHDKDHKHLIGKSLGDLVPHPALTARPIVDVFHRHADHVVFDLSDKLLFDADTGRIWQEDRLAA